MEKFPFVSVIIPTFNRRPLLKKTLTSLKSVNYPKTKMEIIVVDNGSSDGTFQVVKKYFPNVKLFSFPQNKGIPAALNLAIKKSKGKYIFQTNDDVIFAKDCLKILIIAAQSDQKVGIAGGRLYFSDRPKTPMINHLKVNLFIGYHSFRKTPSDKISEVDVVTGASMLIKRKVIEKIGLTDEKFGPYGAEDYEFCFRTKAAGFKVIFCPESVVWVKEFRTNDKKINYQRLFDHYKGKFRFMLLYANPLQNLVFFPTQLLFAPIFCYLQSRKKIVFPILHALLWNLKNLNQTLHTRNKIVMLKNKHVIS
ncbi:MAG: glycosyltransferase family 2 protein [Candidatus Curtissbacteria bacterium]|nr:glycosyltransferase family 2 protein [Candidatus Curtissbacteria bacterium]